MLFAHTTQRQLNGGLAILRLAIGVIFIAHGAQKLFVFGFAGVSGAFEQMGVPMANVMGPFIGFVEFLGGIALILGLLTRLASFGLAADMAVAILLVHLKAGIYLPNGYEFALALLGATALLTLTGAGRISLDGLIAGRGPSEVGPAAVSGNSARRAA